MILLTKRKYFEAIRDGNKTVDIRRIIGPYRNAKTGDEILFMCGREKFTRKIKKVYRGTLEEILNNVDFREIVPWAEDKESFMKSLKEIYPDEKEFIAFRI